MPDLNEQIPKELQMLRKLKMMEFSKAGYSQAQLGDALGITQQTVSKLMSNPKKSKNDG